MAGIAALLSGGGLVAVSMTFMAGAVEGLAVASLVLRRYVVAPRWQLDRSRWLLLLKAGFPIGIASCSSRCFSDWT